MQTKFRHKDNPSQWGKISDNRFDFKYHSDTIPAVNSLWTDGFGIAYKVNEANYLRVVGTTLGTVFDIKLDVWLDEMRELKTEEIDLVWE